MDEVDSILIDEARTPLIISGPAHDDVDAVSLGRQPRPRADPQAADAQRRDAARLRNGATARLGIRPAINASTTPYQRFQNDPNLDQRRRSRSHRPSPALRRRQLERKEVSITHDGDARSRRTNR
jgi:preprotein translocase subunit SecA